LVEVYGSPARTVAECSQLFGAKFITYQSETAPDEINSEMDLNTQASPLGITLFPCGFSTLIDFRNIAQRPQSVSEVFTEFRKKVESKVEIDAPLSLPQRMPKPPENLISQLQIMRQKFKTSDFEILKSEDSTQACAHLYLGGETQGQKRLGHYYWDTHCVASYFDTRNGLLEMNCSTKFSLWLANGSLSARTCYFELKKYENKVQSNKSTYWVFFELLWRDFFKAMSLKHGALLYREGGLQNKTPKRIHTESKEKDLFTRWQKGATGEPLVDACMRELLHTGYMSNRGRQIVASFLIHNLDVRWTWGAWHFESLLIDYDPASNWGNWAYLAGVGNDPRGTRVFNTKRQAETYDPKGEFTKYWSKA
jgi:deoxyribodipyrimidine photo-lyase